MPNPHPVYTVLKDFAVPITALLWGIFVWWRDNRRFLTINWIGTSLTMRISEIEEHRTITFTLDQLCITNDSPKANIVIAGLHLEPPWADSEIEAIPNPQENFPTADRYTVFGSDIDHPRASVLNHRRFQNGKLAPGKTIRGTFLARGKKPIPGDLRLQCPKAANDAAA